MKYLITIINIIILSIGQSQVINDMKIEAERNKSNSSKPPSNQNYSSSGQYYGSALNNASNMNAMYSCFNLLLPLIISEQNRLMSKKEEQPEMSYLEAILDLQLSTTAKQVPFKPRLIGSYGLFATEARWFNLNERNYFDKFDSYNFFDWQVFMLNLLNRKALKLRVGTGFSHEYYTQKQYWENSVSMKWISNNGLWMIWAEYRGMKDQQTNLSIRNELNGGFDVALRKRDRSLFTLGLNASRTEFYEQIKMVSIGPRMTYRIQ